MNRLFYLPFVLLLVLLEVNVKPLCAAPVKGLDFSNTEEVKRRVHFTFGKDEKLSLTKKHRYVWLTDQAMAFRPRHPKGAKEIVEVHVDDFKVHQDQLVTIKVNPDILARDHRFRTIALGVGDYELVFYKDAIMLFGEGQKDGRVHGMGAYMLPKEILNQILTASVRVTDGKLHFYLQAKALNGKTLTCAWAIKQRISDGGMPFKFLVHKGGKMNPIELFAIQSGPFQQPENLTPLPLTPLTRVKRIPSARMGKSGSNPMPVSGQKVLDKPVTKEELDVAIEHALKKVLPPITQHALSFFGQRHYCSTVGWLYRRTGDHRLIDGMISTSTGVISHRNDRFLKLLSEIENPATGQMERVMAPNWEHLRRASWDMKTNEVIVGWGIASFGGQAWPIMTARMITETPAIWQKNYQGNVKAYQGKTYREIGLEMLKEGRVSIDFLMKYYLDPKDMLLKSPKGVEEAAGTYPQWNRIFPAIVANANFVVACRKFKTWPDYANDVEKTVIASMDLFEARLRTHQRGGKKVYSYSYGSTSMTQCEDLGHGSFEHSELGWLYDEGYFKREHAEVFADTIESLYIGNGKFHSRFLMDEVLPQKEGKEIYGGGTGYMWYTKFNPRLLDLICERPLKRGRGFYAYCQMLKIRDG